MSEYPKELIIGLTNLCNANCKFCYRRDTELEPRWFPLGTYMKLLKELGNHLEIVEFSGIGEPLLNQEFPAFVEFTRMNFPKIKIQIATNGSLINRHFEAVSKLDKVWVSLNAASSESYSKIMNTDYNKVLANIVKLSSLNKRPYIEVSMIITEENQTETAWFKKIGKRIADRVMFRGVDRALFPGKVSDLPITDISKKIKCGNLSRTFGVFFTSGEVSPCCYMAGHIEECNCFGNVYRDSAMEIWNRIAWYDKSIRKGEEIKDICRRCNNWWTK